MPKRKVSERLIEEFIKDEKKGAKTYKRYGFKRQSRDERRHAKYFKRKYRKMEKKERS